MLGLIALVRGTFSGRSADRGTAALEFAMIAPMLITLFFGVYDLLTGVEASEQVYNAAHSIAASASSLAVQSDGSTSLTVTNVQQVLSVVFAEVPALRQGAGSGARSVTISSITFSLADPTCVATSSTPCPYVANVAWSVPYADPPTRYSSGANTFLNVTRACGTQNQVTPASYVQGDLTSLPTLGISVPDPIIVVDVHYRYTPQFLSVFLQKPIDFYATALWPVRSINQNSTTVPTYTTYDLAHQSNGSNICAGYL